MRRTLRGHLFGWLALTALLSTALTVLVAAVLVHRRVEGQILTTLGRQADAAAAAVSDGARLPVRPLARVLVQRRGRLVPARRAGLAPAELRALLLRLPGSGDADGRLDDLLYAARGTPAGRLVLLRQARIGSGDWQPFVTSLVLAGLGGALVALLLSVVIARRLATPVRRLSAATRALAAGESEPSVPVQGPEELAELSASFNAMAGDLAAARDADRAFLLSVSHELKTPLTAVRGYAEALADGAVDPAEAGVVIGAESARLERLLCDLLDLGRLERREFAVDLGPVDLAAVAGRAVTRFQSQARELGVGLSGSGEPAAVATGDPERLLQVVSNLVENALLATPAGGTVTVEAAPARMTVRDTGPGLAAEDLPRAFERFYLHDRYAAGRRDGSGLGLAIVRELVTTMGGDVGVDSTPGRGSAFTVRLPVAQDAHSGGSTMGAGHGDPRP